MPDPKYKVIVRRDGSIGIFRTDGKPCLLEDADWMRRLMAADLRQRSIASNPEIAKRRQKIQDEQGASGRDELFEVDPLIGELEAERIRQGVTRADVSRAVLARHDNALTHYTRGRSRPRLDMIRLWAFVLQQTVMLVPAQLEAKILAMIEEWRNQTPVEEVAVVEVEA